MANISADQIEVGLQQMKINTRLTALQASATLMGHTKYEGGVDTATLLEIAGKVQEFVIGDLVKEADALIAKLRAPAGPKIVRP